mmetsp:Transcript_20281/g.42858  ORF Transcript_20281/g.42858 Transcript_20281/m.42858 type:complete len:232 (-) Transcript_20281:301-996(-)
MTLRARSRVGPSLSPTWWSSTRAPTPCVASSTTSSLSSCKARSTRRAAPRAARSSASPPARLLTPRSGWLPSTRPPARGVSTGLLVTRRRSCHPQGMRRERAVRAATALAEQPAGEMKAAAEAVAEAAAALVRPSLRQTTRLHQRSRFTRSAACCSAARASPSRASCRLPVCADGTRRTNRSVRRLCGAAAAAPSGPTRRSSPPRARCIGRRSRRSSHRRASSAPKSSSQA